jgi:hypothetical protein
MLVARTLAGSWRADAPTVDLSASELAAVVPLLLTSGTAPLAWRTVRGSALRFAPAAAELREAYRRSALQTLLHERAITSAFAVLRAANVEPILFKGWLAAGIYSDRGLRPYGDIDLCVRPEQASQAREALALVDANIDLHVGLGDHSAHGAALPNEPLEGLFARSRSVRLGGDVEVRVLAPEDHLVLLCLHLIAHGAARPIHLCDIAAMVDDLPEDFDWDMCLGRSRYRHGWISWAIQLAHCVLDARVDQVPVSVRARRVPGWLEAAVLERWGTPTSVWWPRGRVPVSFLSSLGSGAQAAGALRGRWPNPVQAAIELVPPVWWMPRLMIQLASFMVQAGRFASRLHDAIQVERVHARGARP